MGGLSSLRRLEAYALFCVRYPHPKSLPSGKGLALALSGSKSGVSPLRNLSSKLVPFSFVGQAAKHTNLRKIRGICEADFQIHSLYL